MSGRSGYRKTDRRNPRFTAEARREVVLRKGGFAPDEVRLVFLLPATLAPFVAPGHHGIGVTVIGRGFVRISGKSSEHCFYLAQGFFETIAKEHSAFTVPASVTRAGVERTYACHLTVVKGALVETDGMKVPRVFEGAA